MKIIKSKKGNLVLGLLSFLFSEVWILLGIALFILVFFGMSYFMLGKILGAVLIVFGLLGYLRGLDPRMTVFVILAGIFVMLNPFHWETLQMMR